MSRREEGIKGERCVYVLVDVYKEKVKEGECSCGEERGVK
jgi:hypothetical protein